mmetsp:Transcript_8030/g.23891  ORF Transcript_8030/g.23891 Transcript_8030/m.23891 type:complete len:405 (+) Transcript_8030:690-1904(+)
MSNFGDGPLCHSARGRHHGYVRSRGDSRETDVEGGKDRAQSIHDVLPPGTQREQGGDQRGNHVIGWSRLPPQLQSDGVRPEHGPQRLVHRLREERLFEDGGRAERPYGRSSHSARDAYSRQGARDEQREGGHRGQRHHRHVPSQDHRRELQRGVEGGDRQEVYQRGHTPLEGGIIAPPHRTASDQGLYRTRARIEGLRDGSPHSRYGIAAPRSSHHPRTRGTHPRPPQSERRPTRPTRHSLHGILSHEGRVHLPPLLHRKSRRSVGCQRHAGTQRPVRLGERPCRIRREYLRIYRRHRVGGRFGLGRSGEARWRQRWRGGDNGAGSQRCSNWRRGCVFQPEYRHGTGLRPDPSRPGEAMRRLPRSERVRDRSGARLDGNGEIQRGDHSRGVRRVELRGENDRSS